MEEQLFVLAPSHYHLQLVAPEVAHCLHRLTQLLLRLGSHQHHQLPEVVTVTPHPILLSQVVLRGCDNP